MFGAEIMAYYFWKIDARLILYDRPKDVNSKGRRSGIFESSVSERNYCHGVATRRDPIPFETGDESKEPKSIRWGKVWAVEDGNSEGKDGILKVELQSHK